MGGDLAYWLIVETFKPIFNPVDQPSQESNWIDDGVTFSVFPSFLLSNRSPLSKIGHWGPAIYLHYIPYAAYLLFHPPIRARAVGAPGFEDFADTPASPSNHAPK